MTDNEFEHLLVGDEVRAEGRTIVGDVMVYGDRALSRRERFERGSLELAPVTHLDYEHDRRPNPRLLTRRWARSQG